MSLDYYAKYPGQTGKGLLIGNYSIGWEFLWQAHTDLKLVSIVDWYKFLDLPWVTIIDERKVVNQFNDFWDMATARIGHGVRNRSHHASELPHWRDRAGCLFVNDGPSKVPNTITVTHHRRGRFVVECSQLPGRTFGPWSLVETIQDLRVSAMLSSLDARNLILDAVVNGSATTEIG